MRQKLSRASECLLWRLAAERESSASHCFGAVNAKAVAELTAVDLAFATESGALALTEAGRAHVARRRAALDQNTVDPFVAQHLALSVRTIQTPAESVEVQVDDSESPLAWLARRKGKDGQPLVAPVQLLAGERLRAEFTRGQLTPRVTSSWQIGATRGPGGSRTELADTILAARERVRRALDAVGPEFSGLLLDVCCFLKGLADVERERQWPARSAKVVLQLGLDRLARHYGLGDVARGPVQGRVRTWANAGALSDP